MIIVLSGTLEGREITSLLTEKGYEVLAITAVELGTGIVVKTSEGVVEKHSSRGGLETVINSRPAKLIIDTTHPFPARISETAKELCREKKINYLRFVRQEVVLPDSPLLYPVYSWEEAAKQAAKLGNTIFMTTGSYNLEGFLKHPDLADKRVVVRVLPEHRVIEKVQSLGIVPRDIVAMHGPFSKDINRATFKMYNASVIVTKDSGRAGGTDSKIAAALSLNIPVVIIKRTGCKDESLDTVENYPQLLERVKQLY